ncbi:MAG: RluA family pseudouridine synthase [Oscillospiraceae bacterium]|nr:RluA family pseudouridine synthase [Oscillospiraceae bacterium]
MKVLFEDKFIIIVEKPASVLSEPDGKGEDIVTMASAHVCKPCFLVHRLDRNTGGAMVLSKMQKATGKLSEAIQKREFEKEYIAVIKGVPEDAEGIFKDLLFKDSQKNKTFVVKRERKGVKEASLEYKVLSTAEHPEHGKISLVLIKLHTGRTHQIRVQFASRKMPLLGDGKYGSRDNHCETALWSRRLFFKHPITGENVEAISMPPKEYPWNLFDIDSLL